MENPIVNSVENVEQSTEPVVDIQEKTNEVVINLKNDINERLMQEEQTLAATVVDPVVTESVPVVAETNTIVDTPTETKDEVKEIVGEAQVPIATTETVAVTTEATTTAEITHEVAEPVVETPSTETPSETPAVVDAALVSTTETAPSTATKDTATKDKKKKEKKEKKKEKKNDENVEPGSIESGHDTVKRKESVGAKIKRVFTLGKSDKNKKHAGVATENGQAKVEAPSTLDEKPEVDVEAKQAPVVAETSCEATVVVVVSAATVVAGETHEVPAVDAEAIAAAGDSVPMAKDVELVTDATVKEAACAVEAAAAAASGDAQQDAATATSPIDKSQKHCIII